MCTKLRTCVSLITVLLGMLIGYGIFWIIFQANRAGTVTPGEMRQLRGNPNGLRLRHEKIYNNLMAAQPTGLMSYSLGKSLTSEQAKWLDQERQFLCLLSTEKCAPFPSNWADNIDEKVENLLVKFITGSESQKGIMGEIKANLKKDPTANIKYSTMNTVKQGLKDFGNEFLDDGEGKHIDYLGTKWDKCPVTGRKIGSVEGRSIQRTHVVIQRMLELMRKGPISVFELTLSTLDEMLEAYRKYARQGTLKFMLKSLPFKNRVNVLYARLDQCFSVMPLWFLQVINISLNSLHMMKGTKLPYNLSLFSKPLIYGLFEDRALKMIEDYGNGNPHNAHVPGLKRHKDENGWFWSFMLKSLMASNVSKDCRKEIRRKNRATLRKLGVEQSSLERLGSNNKVLGTIAKAVGKSTGKGSKWAQELSGILENRAEVRKANGYLEKFPKGKTKEECKINP